MYLASSGFLKRTWTIWLKEKHLFDALVQASEHVLLDVVHVWMREKFLRGFVVHFLQEVCIFINE